MFGDPYYYWSNTTKKGAEMYFTMDCNNCHLIDHPQFKKTVTNQINLSDLDDSKPIADAIEEQFGTRVTNWCPNRDCPPDAQSTLGPLTAETDKHCLINVDLSSLPECRIQGFNEDLVAGHLPTILHVNQKPYQLGHVQFNISDSHFVSWHFDTTSNKMVHYDSSANRDKDMTKFRVATLSEIAKLKPTSLQYFRTNWDSLISSPTMDTS